uniref:Protein gamma response 1 n=1 Tax=Carex littledalei TaxID=544730 RepID=A0A833QK57_9POAL|nr:protein gamma response 1 [Carex littledalei]
MEGKSIDSPNLEIFAPKSDDFKYICSLSTILVATIQEVKDRVSQIELIFCSQLFPKFQSNSKSFQKKQEEWKERETNLLSLIGELKLSLLKEREERDKLLKEIECKDQGLLVEQSKRRDMVRDFGTLKERYNSLKSQYTYLIGKLEDFDEIDTKEISPYTELRKPKLSPNLMSTSTRSPPNCISDNEEKIPWCQTNKVSTSPRLHPKSTSVKLTETLSGQKRPTTWRDTRAHQKPCGADPDPHDDFLDTPIEMARKSKPDKSSTSSARCIPVPPPQDMDFNNSDEETQDLTSNKISIQNKEKGFKFIEPVRKKAERENLKGIECKQCKKFYDAVLPKDGEGKEQCTDGIGTSLKCEHHEGVSRHRYRYAPPMTPEGLGSKEKRSGVKMAKMHGCTWMSKAKAIVLVVLVTTVKMNGEEQKR